MKAQRLEHLVEKHEELDKSIWDRRPKPIKVAAGNARLGFLTVPIFILRCPGLQMTPLYTRGFRVAGVVEPSSIYPLVSPKADNFS